MIFDKPVKSQELTPCPLSDVEKLSGQFRVLVHGYCLMTNPYHDIALYLCRKLRGQRCRELGLRLGGISGAAIIM